LISLPLILLLLLFSSYPSFSPHQLLPPHIPIRISLHLIPQLPCLSWVFFPTCF
jgi:hypothetical protein